MRAVCDRPTDGLGSVRGAEIPSILRSREFGGRDGMGCDGGAGRIVSERCDICGVVCDEGTVG